MILAHSVIISLSLQAKKLQSLRQEDDPNSQNDLDKKIKEVEINKEALENTGAEIARNIPPYNSAATDPKEAYPLEKIILSGEWSYITDIIELFERGEKLPADVYPSFVCNRVYKLEEIKVWLFFDFFFLEKFKNLVCWCKKSTSLVLRESIFDN